MKKLLLLLLALMPLLGQAQRSDNPRTVVRSCEKCADILYYIKVIVPAYTYSPDSVGRVRFQRDILAGKFDLYTDAGVKIPKGTKPPRIMPTGSNTTNPATGPTWASLRYSLSSAGLFYVEGSGTEIARLKVERADGTALAGRNDDNPSLPGNTFYGYGGNPNQGLYDRQWKFYFTPAIAGKSIKLTLERTNGETYAYTFTPSSGADRLTLFTAGTSSGTPVSTTTTSYPKFSRMLVIANSIGTHTASTALGWDKDNGMAASAPEKDYVHLMETALRQANPNLVVTVKGQGSSLELSYNSTDTAAVTNTIRNLVYELRQTYGPDVKFDAIYYSVGENTPNENFDETKYRKMLDKVFAAIPSNGPPTIMLRSSFWSGNESSNAVQQSYASSKGYKFVDLTPIRERADYKASQYANSSVARHPNDLGHAAIAELSLAPLRGSTVVVTNPTDGGGGGNYAFTNPNPDYVGVADQGWLNEEEKFVDNGTIKIGILDAGGVIATARLNRDGRGLFNTAKVGYDDNPADPRFGKTVYDLGRSYMAASDYFTPGPSEGYQFLTKNADGSFKSTKTGYKGRAGSTSQGQHIFNTGGNTVQGGSLWPALTKSPILASAKYRHPTRGDEVYVKTRPAIWGVGGELGNIVVEEWISFPLPNVIHVYARHTVEERNPAQVAEQRRFEMREQENPCIYVIAPLTQHLINLPGEPRKNIWPGVHPDPRFSSTYHVADCKVGAYEGDGGTGVTLYSPMSSAFKTGQFGSGSYSTAGSEYSHEASYLNGATRMNYDNPGIYDDDNYTVLGTENEANAAIAKLPGIDQSFSFDFGRENMRWWNVDSRLKRESGNQWTWYLDLKSEQRENGTTSSSYLCKIQSPWRAWTASSLTAISFEMAVTGASQLDMIWERPGPDNQIGYSKRFNVTGDGQFRTYTVSTNDPNWFGTITTVGLQAVNGATSPNAKVIFRKIYKN